ncbi:Copia protein, partial [Mucuna pruriens]
MLALAAHLNWQLLQYDVKNTFLHGDRGSKVCKLQNGLKQSPRAWFGRCTKAMKEFGYIPTKIVTELLAKIGKLGCKPVATPMDPNNKLGEAQEEPTVDKQMYQRLMGKLIYLAYTKPDIAYLVSVISHYMHNPRESHLQAAYRILHYLKDSLRKGILFKRNNILAFEAYTNVNYAGSLVIRRSTSRYCTFLGGNLIAQVLCELLWLKIILDDLRIELKGLMKLYCDKSAINIAYNPVQHDRTKHIEIDRHFIKEKFEEGLMCMSYVPSTQQLADFLTKGLNSSTFHGLIIKLAMEDIYSSA